MPKEFTLEELNKFQGLEGRPAYIAFKGKVYDVSEVFLNGDHNGINAGEDITEDFGSSPHEENIFLKYKVVGNLIN